MNDFSIDEVKKIIVRLMKISVVNTDEELEKIAADSFDPNDKDFENQKKAFVADIHRILGR